MTSAITITKLKSLAHLRVSAKAKHFDATLKACLARAASEGIAPYHPPLRILGTANGLVLHLNSYRAIRRVS